MSRWPLVALANMWASLPLSYAQFGVTAEWLEDQQRNQGANADVSSKNGDFNNIITMVI